MRVFLASILLLAFMLTYLAGQYFAAPFSGLRILSGAG